MAILSLKEVWENVFFTDHCELRLDLGILFLGKKRDIGGK
jgi:hypothetical protein